MRWTLGKRALVAAACAALLAGCNPKEAPTAAAPRGATVAFDSIDGLPQGHFRTLVKNLNDEAQSRRLGVISREQKAVYRVRGYLAAHVTQGRTTVSWVWDVFDGNEQRALRIVGEETGKGGARDAWAVADDAMLQRIARTSMDRLAEFLVAPDATVPAAQPASPEPAATTLVSLTDSSTPEAAGIFRLPQTELDPARGTGTAPHASLAPDETLALSALSHQN